MLSTRFNKSIVVLILSVLFVQAAGAVTYSRPSALLNALSADNRPVDMRSVVTVQVNREIQARLEVSGSWQGKHAKPLDTQADLSMKLVVSERGSPDMMITGTVRMLNGKLYGKITELSSHPSLQELQEYAQKWHVIDLQELLKEQDILTAEQQSEQMKKADRFVDALLLLERKDNRSYALRLQKNALAGLVPLIEELRREQQPGYSLSREEKNSLRMFLRALRMNIVVQADGTGLPSGSIYTISYKAKGIEAQITGSMNIRSTPMSVTAPTDAIDLLKESNQSLNNARDAQRRSDVNTILNAIYQYAIDNNGKLPGSLPSTPKELCRKRGNVGTCPPSTIDINTELTGYYLVVIPRDPSLPRELENGSTGYFVSVDNNRRVTVSAPRSEGGSPISVTR